MRKWYSINSAVTADTAEVWLYDYIGYWGKSAADFVSELRALPASATTVVVRINSGGGEVFDGIAIYNALRSLGRKIVVKVDGLAASIASVIAMAGDEIEVAANGFLMIHNPWTTMAGGSSDLRKTADDLDKIRESLLGTYETRAGGKRDRAALSAALDAETWLSASDAVDWGLADRVGAAIPVQAAVTPRAWARAPEAALAWLATDKTEEVATDGTTSTADTDDIASASTGGDAAGVPAAQPEPAANSGVIPLADVARRCDEAYAQGRADTIGAVTEEVNAVWTLRLAGLTTAARETEAGLRADVAERESRIVALAADVARLTESVHSTTERLAALTVGFRADFGEESPPADYWAGVERLTATGMDRNTAQTEARKRWPDLHVAMVKAANTRA